MLRVLIATAVALTALGLAAQAQQRQGPGMSYEPPPENKPLYDERKYKAAIDRVPEAMRSNDPWAGAREPAPPPAAAQAPAPKARAKQTTQR